MGSNARIVEPACERAARIRRPRVLPMRGSCAGTSRSVSGCCCGRRSGGLWIASEGQPDEWILFVFVLGTIVLRSAGCIINDFADRKVDPLVGRTADRPLATGEVTTGAALTLFGALMLIGLGLVLTLNSLTVQLAVIGAVIAVVYPFTKRFIATPQFVLGIAFAWGVPMAFARPACDGPAAGLAAVPGRRHLGHRLRHAIRDGRPRGRSQGRRALDRDTVRRTRPDPGRRPAGAVFSSRCSSPASAPTSASGTTAASDSRPRSRSISNT